MANETGNRLTVAVLLAVLTFLHLALRPLFDDWVARPNLLVCGLLVSARYLRAGSAAIIGLVLGLLEDAMAVSYFGLAALLLTMLGYLGARTKDLFLGEEPLFMGAYLFVGTWLYGAATHLVATPGSGVLARVFLDAPANALATAVVGYLVVPLLRR